MPIYSFKCPECGKCFEELLPISKNDSAACPACGSKVERVWSGKCSFGSKKSSGCSGNCATCSGCGK